MAVCGKLCIFAGEFKRRRDVKYIGIILLIALAWGCKEKKQAPFRYFTNYQRTFNDMNPRHLQAAKACGIEPITSEEDMEEKLDEMEEIESCRFYTVDKLTHSLPYLVPKAEELLKDIGRNFRDSLDSKGLPSRKVIVTSVLRTAATVKDLRKSNINASANSAHVYGTTFDISYNRYVTVEDPDGPERRRVRNDTLKWILSEVLYDQRMLGTCYVKYEVKQGCFHVTAR